MLSSFKGTIVRFGHCKQTSSVPRSILQKLWNAYVAQESWKLKTLNEIEWKVTHMHACLHHRHSLECQWPWHTIFNPSFYESAQCCNCRHPRSKTERQEKKRRRGLSCEHAVLVLLWHLRKCKAATPLATLTEVKEKSVNSGSYVHLREDCKQDSYTSFNITNNEVIWKLLSANHFQTLTYSFQCLTKIFNGA